MIEIVCEQRSEVWFACRLGIATASGFSKVMTSKFEISAQRAEYGIELATERITGKRVETHINSAMQHGIDYEDEAALCYSMDSGEDVREVGFCYYDDRRSFGVSPDRMVGEDGILEIKCPQPKTLLKFQKDGKLPTRYIQQIYGQLLVTGRDWCDFYAYHPAEELRPFQVRIEKDDDKQNKVLRNLNRFADEVDRLTNFLKENANG